MDAGPLVRLLSLFQRQSPGRVVLLRGLPQMQQAYYIERLLSRHYSLARDTVPWTHVDGITRDLGPVVKLVDIMGRSLFNSSFLVRLATVSDAVMLVRRWHRSAFTNKDGLLREQWTNSDEESWGMRKAESEIPDDPVDSLEEHDTVPGNRRMGAEESIEARTAWQTQIRQARMLGNTSNGEGIRCMVDAYLMH
jgi:hypothetical protein